MISDIKGGADLGAPGKYRHHMMEGFFVINENNIMSLRTFYCTANRYQTK